MAGAVRRKPISPRPAPMPFAANSGFGKGAAGLLASSRTDERADE
jgi:hypothetical protein